MKRDHYSSLDASTRLPPTRFLLHVSHPVYAIVDATRVHGWILFVEVWSWRIRELCGVVFSRVFRIWRNITFEKYRFPLYSRFSWDEKLYSFFLFLFRRRTRFRSLLKSWTSREFLVYIHTIWNRGKIIKVYNYFRNHWIGICSKLLRCNQRNETSNELLGNTQLSTGGVNPLGINTLKMVEIKPRAFPLMKRPRGE